jgi:disulfide bond formation protein DsbB
MPAYVSTLVYGMALGTVVLDLALIIGILALFHAPSREKIFRMSERYGILAILMLSVLAVAGTLLIEFVGGLAPCIFCWWQRIFMYPIAIISFIAFLKNVKPSDIADYVLALSVIGALFSLYQHLLQVLPTGALIPCDATNDCAVRSVFDFGFVTIPWMALSVFAAFALIAFLGRKGRKGL